MKRRCSEAAPRLEAQLLGRTATILWVVASAVSIGCWPAHPSNAQLVGTWEATHDFGRETLVLKADGTYRQIFTGVDGRMAENVGQWNRGSDERLSLSGLKLILRDARPLEFRPTEPARPSGLENRELEAVFEWGQTMLIFDPDLPGFRKK